MIKGIGFLLLGVLAIMVGVIISLYSLLIPVIISIIIAIVCSWVAALAMWRSERAKELRLRGLTTAVSVCITIIALIIIIGTIQKYG